MEQTRSGSEDGVLRAAAPSDLTGKGVAAMIKTRGGGSGSRVWGLEGGAERGD